MSVSWRKNITFKKDPDEVLDYTLDLSNWLPTGDTVASHVVTVDSGIVLDSSTNTTTTVTAWISGGTVSTTYDVAFKATTNDGRIIERTIRLRIETR